MCGCGDAPSCGIGGGKSTWRPCVIQASSNQEVRDGNSICSLGPHGREAGETGALDAVAEIPVSDDGKDGVEGGSEPL